jgi:hypothetical protein
LQIILAVPRKPELIALIAFEVLHRQTFQELALEIAAPLKKQINLQE